MFSSFLLALREGVEAALVVGILFGALRKLQRPELARSVWWGVISAALVSLLVALGLRIAGTELEGAAEEIFEGFTMLAAAALLTWMIFWMHRQARFLRSKIESEVRRAAGTSQRALFGVAFLTVVREGVELALFLVAAGLASDSILSLFGALGGLVIAAVLGWVLFRSTRRLPLGKFFQVTNILLILFAAGLVAHGIHEFNEVGWIPAVVEHLYDLNPVLPESSVFGQFLQALFGYNADPSLTEVVGYFTYFAVLLLSLVRIQRRTAATVAEG